MIGFLWNLGEATMQGIFRKHRRANSLFEYIAVFCMVTLVFVGMAKYVQHGMQGNMRKAGETFGYGRQ